MAKESYSIRSSLDKSFLDHEIPLGAGGVSLKPMPIKQLLFYAAGLLITLWVCTSTFVSKTGFGLIALTVIWLLWITFYFGATTKTKELRALTIPALAAYLPKKARYVFTRRSSNPSDFYSIVGIAGIDEDGEMQMADGGAGQLYLLVGSASAMLFSDDRTAILDRVQAFWQKVPVDVEYEFITTAEPQRVHVQVARLEERNLNLEIRDPDLLNLQDEKYELLTKHVGREFTSLHQYVFVRAKNAETLRQGHVVLQAEVEGSPLMIKELTALDREETLETFRVFFTALKDENAVVRS